MTKRQKKKSNEYYLADGYLCALGYTEYYPKQHIRILFNAAYDQERNETIITDLVVAEFTIGGDYDLADHPNQKLYDLYHRDIGNCLSNWQNWNPLTILVDLLGKYGFKDKEARRKVLLELTKIEELREEIGFMFYQGHFQ